MPRPLWSFEQLSRLTRYEDAEVRHWAADRLVHLYPEKAAAVVSDLLFDEHESTSSLVAGHLAEHGDASQTPILERGFKKGTGALAGQCLAALAKLGYAKAPALAREALRRNDLPETALAEILGGLAAMSTSSGSEEAADAAWETLLRRPELYALPEALRECFKIFGDNQVGELAGKWITALHFSGIESAEPGIRVFQSELKLEEISWCLRTGRSGRVDLDRSLRAIENGYDCEVRGKIGEAEREALASAFAEGEFREMARQLAERVEKRALELSSREGAGDDKLLRRLAALASAFRDDEILTEAERLGHAMHTWLISLLLSALFKTAAYRNLEADLEKAGENLDALLELAELESSYLAGKLPEALARAAGEGSRDRMEQWCVATLESRGPFFPKVIAIKTIGEMKLGAQLPLILDYLSDDNGYIYGAAEKVLRKFGDDAVDLVRAEIERRKLHPDALSSILVVLADLMTPAALSLAVDRFDDFMLAAGPEEGSELMAMLGDRALIPYLRRWYKRAEGSTNQVAVQARVGHALLLIGAIHNVAIPEEERILQAIDEYWKETPEEAAGGGPFGPYVM